MVDVSPDQSSAIESMHLHAAARFVSQRFGRIPKAPICAFYSMQQANFVAQYDLTGGCL